MQKIQPKPPSGPGWTPPRIGYRSVGLPIISIISAPQLAPLLHGLLSNTDSLVGLANVAARGHDLCVRLHWPKLDFGGSSPLKTPCREADLDLSRRRRQRRLPSAVLPLLRRHRLGLPSMPRLPQTLLDVPGVTRNPGERARGNPLAPCAKADFAAVGRRASHSSRRPRRTPPLAPAATCTR